MKKRISAIFLAVSICLSLLPAAAAAGDDGVDTSYIYDEAAHTAVGLSNILDRELCRRKPAKRPHREVVGAANMCSELLGKIVQ